MQKFRIVGDPNNRPFCSSQIIIDSTNKAAKKLGLYDENGKTVVYDCLCNSHGYNADAFWCAYELPFPIHVLNNAGLKPIIGLSKDNAWMAVEGGYPRHLVNYVSLGVDTDIWKPQEKTLYKDKFVVLSMIESTVRSGLNDLIAAFGQAFGGQTDVLLYIKDREPTEQFREYVKTQSKIYNIEIIHDCRHTENHEEEMKIFSMADCHVYLNHAGTWCMTVTQGMACGIPTIGVRYSGPNDYLSHEINGIGVNYKLEKVSQFNINDYINMGMKNFLFPINEQNYLFPPYWANFDTNNIRDILRNLKNDISFRNKLRKNAILTAKWFSWERTAVNMSYVLSTFDK